MPDGTLLTVPLPVPAFVTFRPQVAETHGTKEVRTRKSWPVLVPNASPSDPHRMRLLGLSDSSEMSSVAILVNVAWLKTERTPPVGATGCFARKYVNRESGRTSPPDAMSGKVPTSV